MRTEAGSSSAGAGLPLRVRRVEAGVRDMRLRLPFRFGQVTLTRCPQLFVRAEVEVAGHGSAFGHAAEMMVPRWFDKRSERDAAHNIADLATAFTRAAQAYENDQPASAFGLFERHCGALAAAGRSAGETALSTTFGQAVLDRAVLDALCRAAGLPVHEALARNLPGLADTPLLPDLAGWDWNGWLRTRHPAATLQARHTIGMLDALDDEPAGVDAQALPATLPAVIRRYGHRFFKIKLGGDPQADLDRLDAVLAVLDRLCPQHRYTLDGNEQYADIDRLAHLADGLRTLPRVAQRPQALLYLEQPLPRDGSFVDGLAALRLPVPLLLDEGDAALDSFVQARAAGWAGISSKGCKGIWKALANRARREQQASAHGTPPFLSAEDLTCQAGLSVQQDLAWAALLGLTHAERNGHHYVDGFGTAPDAEAQAFAKAHPDLYECSAGRPRLAIREGAIALDSLFAQPGFATGALPHIDHLAPLDHASSMV